MCLRKFKKKVKSKDDASVQIKYKKTDNDGLF